MRRLLLLTGLWAVMAVGNPQAAEAQVNANPVITAPATASAVTGVSITLTGSASDPDGENVTLSQSNNVPFFTSAGTSGPSLNPSITLTGTPSAGQCGSWTINWSAADSHVPAATAAATTSVSIGGCQSPPVITAPATAAGATNNPISITASALDADANGVTLSQTNNAPFLAGPSSVGPALNPSLTLSGTPTFTQGGSYTIQWTAVETGSPALTSQATTAVQIGSQNRAPVIAAPVLVNSALFVALSVTGSASDPDAQNVTLTQSNNASFLTGPSSAGPALTAAITLTGTPGFANEGTFTINWAATDSNVPLAGNATATTTLVIGGLNRNPVITVPFTLSGPPFNPIAITATAADPDAENVTLSQTNNAPFFPNGTSAGPSPNPSLTLSGTPGASQNGVFVINWTAVDSHVPAGTSAASTSVVIGGPGRPPVITAPLTVSAMEGVPLSITASAADPDNELVTLCAGPRPAFLIGPVCSGPSLNPSLTLSGTPGYSDAGNYTIVWTATDGSSVSTAFTTMLTIADVNRTPVLTQPFDMTLDEGTVATQQLTATDPDGNALLFFKVGTTPFFMSVSAAGLVTLTPGFADAGNYTATVRVSDGTTSDTKFFAIVVVNVNRCPVAISGGPYHGVKSAAVNFDGSASADPDGDPLSYAWDFGDGFTGSGAMTAHTYSVAAVYAVTLSVNDGSCQAVSTTTALIDDEFGAFAFTTGGNGSVSLGSGKPFFCVQVEPMGDAFAIGDVDLGSIKMVSVGTGAVSEIAAAAGKTTVGGDKNGNGVTEFRSCFAKEDLRQLFSLLPAGRNDVTVFIDGSLTTGGVFRASFVLAVKSTGGALAASISPNPLNPSARLTFGTTKAGAVRVQLFDLNGRLVRTYLDDRAAAAGYHDVTIDGRTSTGGRVPSGVYFVKIWTEHEGSITRSLTILK